MPIYEFHCDACNARFEQLMTMTPRALPMVCPTCGEPARRVLSVFASHSPGGSQTDTAVASGGGGCCGGGCCGGGCGCGA